MYGTDTQYGSANTADPNYGGGPSSSTGTWAANSLGQFNCWGAIHNIMNQNGGAFAPTAWVNGHDHANTMAFNQDFNTNTMFITSGTGSAWQSGDGASAQKFAGADSTKWPSQPGPGPKGMFPANTMFTSTGYDVNGQNTIGNGGISVLTMTPSAFKADYWITQNGVPTPAPCDIGAECNLSGPCTNGPNMTLAVISNVINTADSPNNTCTVCSSPAANPACATYVQTLGGGYMPNGYITSGSVYGSSIVPSAPVFSCAASGGVPTCTCSAPATAYAVCKTAAFTPGIGSTYPAFAAPPAPSASAPLGVTGTKSASIFASVPKAPAAAYPPPGALQSGTVPNKAVSGAQQTSENMYTGVALTVNLGSATTIVLPVIGGARAVPPYSPLLLLRVVRSALPAPH